MKLNESKSKANPKPPREKSLFSPVASRVSRAFLSAPQQYWTQTRIAGEFDLSLGHVNGVCKELQKKGYILRKGDFWKLLDVSAGAALLKEWSANYEYSYNHLHHFSSYTPELQLTEDWRPAWYMISEKLTRNRISLDDGRTGRILSKWAATLLRPKRDRNCGPVTVMEKAVPYDWFAYIEIPITVVAHYRQGEWDPDIEQEVGGDSGGLWPIGLVELARGIGLAPSYSPSKADVILIEPYDKYVFYKAGTVEMEAKEKEGLFHALDIPAVSPLQLYLDYGSFARQNLFSAEKTRETQEFLRQLEAEVLMIDDVSADVPF